MKRFFLSDSFSMLDLLLIALFVMPLVQRVDALYGTVPAVLACIVLGLAVSRFGLWLQRKAGIRTVTLGGGL